MKDKKPAYDNRNITAVDIMSTSIFLQIEMSQHMSKKWWLLICVKFEIKVFWLLLNHTEYLMSPVAESVSPECKAASTLATVWPSHRHCFVWQDNLSPEWFSTTWNTPFGITLFTAVASVDAVIIPWVTLTAQRQ